MTKSSYGALNTRNVIIVACVALIVLLGSVAIIVSSLVDTGEMGEREDILLKIEELGDTDLGHKTVAAHILEYGIGGFDGGKLRRVEAYFSDKYLNELPAVGAMAKQTAELFMTYFYDRVDVTDKEQLTAALLNCYTEATGDKYAVYRTVDELREFDEDMSGSFIGIGVSVYQKIDPISGKVAEVRVNSVLGGSGAATAGIQTNDLIVAVDGTPIGDFDSGSLIRSIRGEEGTTVDITVLRGGAEITLSCERRKVVDLTVLCDVRDGIAYITVTTFKSNTPELFAAALDKAGREGARGIVFDLRDNPGGYLDSVLEMLDMLVGSGQRLASYVEADGRETVYKSSGSGTALSIPAVVIVNENTASAAELFAAALADWNERGVLAARIVGATTYGKGVMQKTYTLYDGSSITLTTAHYNPPSGKNYDGKGVVPSIKFELDDGSDKGWLEDAKNALLAMMTLPPASNPNTAA